jgi:hypothetical protein
VNQRDFANRSQIHPWQIMRRQSFFGGFDLGRARGDDRRRCHGPGAPDSSWEDESSRAVLSRSRTAHLVVSVTPGNLAGAFDVDVVERPYIAISLIGEVQSPSKRQRRRFASQRSRWSVTGD